MAEEREIYRTRIRDYDPHSKKPRMGICIVTSMRVIVRWDSDTVDQYPFPLITSVSFNNLVRPKPGVVIKLSNNETEIYQTPEAKKLASIIQNTMVPF